MWTTYSWKIYLYEEMSIDEDKKNKEISLEDVLPDGWVILEGEDEELPWYRKWEDESEDVKEKLKKNGIYTIPFDKETQKLIDEVYTRG